MRNFENPERGMRHMSKWLKSLPENVVINKGLTGCGATTLAINQERDTIIAVPYTALIVNKTSQEEHKDVLLGLYGPSDNFKPAITGYMETHPRMKIMTTYDSLPKVCAILESLEYNPYKKAHLVIDEWHLLFTCLDFRGNATRGVLDEATRFEAVTYISATPIDNEYWFEEMRGLDKWEIEWPDAKTVQTHRIKTGSPVKTAALLCKNRITDGIGPNYHFFLNSVIAIAEILQRAGLRPEDCRIICANNRDNQAKLPQGFAIADTGDQVKPINFYTSTCFEGCDIFDTNGYTFIICDPHRPNTLLDISTSMLQISGRIRDSRYKGNMAIIYNMNRYEDTDSLEAYKKRVKEEMEKAERNAMGMNMMDEDFRKQIIAKIKEFDAPFISEKDGMIVVNKDLVNLDIVSYKIVHGLYKSQVSFDEELRKNNIEVSSDLHFDSNLVELMSVEQISFRDCCEQYNSIKQEKGLFQLNEDIRLVRLRNLCSEACQAVDKLGIDEIRKMNYHKQNIHRKLVKEATLPQQVKIKRELDLRFNKFEAYSIPTIKRILGEIYQDVGLGKKPVATDLKNWYRIRRTKKDGQDAIVIEGDAFIII